MISLLNIIFTIWNLFWIYNEVGLQGAIDYIALKVKLEGVEEKILAESNQKLEAARERCKELPAEG